VKLSGRKLGYLKVNRKGKERIVILSVLLISFLLAPFISNFNINNNLIENNQKNEEFPINYFKTQDLAVDDSYEDTGAPWKVSHWANRTDKETGSMELSTLEMMTEILPRMMMMTINF